MLTAPPGAYLNPGNENAGRAYDDLYKAFDSDLMRQLRAEAYGSDIGQHSWVTETDLREDIAALGLTRASTVFDLGCGPGGPLTYIASQVGCRGIGADCSASAITAGRSRIESMGLADRVSLYEWNLDEPIPVADSSYDAVLSLDVMPSPRPRRRVSGSGASSLPARPLSVYGCRVVSGDVTEEVQRVHPNHPTGPAGLNERLVQESGLALLRNEDRTTACSRTQPVDSPRLAHRSEPECYEEPYSSNASRHTWKPRLLSRSEGPSHGGCTWPRYRKKHVDRCAACRLCAQRGHAAHARELDAGLLDHRRHLVIPVVPIIQTRVQV